MTHTLVNVSALPTQRETPVIGVRQATGVTTPQQVARYTHTQTHRRTHKLTHTHTRTIGHTNILVSLAVQL